MPKIDVSCQCQRRIRALAPGLELAIPGSVAIGAVASAALGLLAIAGCRRGAARNRCRRRVEQGWRGVDFRVTESLAARTRGRCRGEPGDLELWSELAIDINYAF